MTQEEILLNLKEEIERHLDFAMTKQNESPDMPKYRWYFYQGKKEVCKDLLDHLYGALGLEKL